jgi:splicing factor U2AF subunit
MSRDGQRDRSRSPSPAPLRYDPNKERRRPTWFDIEPVGGAPPIIDTLPGAVQVISDEQSSLAAPASASNQATRHARRIYIGGLPPGSREDQVGAFISNALAAVGGTTAGPGASVINVYVNRDKNFAFLELRTVEETSNAMALDGVMFEGVAIRIRRPADYNATAAVHLGPCDPNPNLNLAAIALDKPVKTKATTDTSGQASNVYQEDPDRLFVGGVPYYLSEDEIKELLGTFGAIRYFNLIRDKVTGQSKGYAFFIYEDPSVVQAAIGGLDGMKLGDRAISVRRADPQKAPRPTSVAATNDGSQQAMFTAVPPKVVSLANAVTNEELADDEDYEEILEDMREEAARFGKVVDVHIPRPGKGGADPPGVGLVLLEFAAPESALKARNAMHGRKFDSRAVEATLMLNEDYQKALGR